MVKSYRILMATTRAVLRDAATMVRRLRQRVRTASPPIRSILLPCPDRTGGDAPAEYLRWRFEINCRTVDAYG